MKFDELEKRMRIFETAHDHRVLPGLFMISIDMANYGLERCQTMEQYHAL